MSELGSLYIVATPIGNRSDITLRAIEVLKQVDIIAAEDTRNTLRLLQHYEISTHCVAVHDHNEQQRTQWLETQLRDGKSVALVSDAGTPLINDPGYHLVSHCQAQGLNVVPIPGACAAITALCAAGLPTDRFLYEGFFPAKSKARQDRLHELKQQPRTMVFYESPHRILDSLRDVVLCLGPSRRIVLARELTKTFETIKALSADDMLQWVSNDANQQRGEMVLIIEGYKKDDEALEQTALDTLRLLKQELPLKKAAALTAQIHGAKKNLLYQWGLDNL